MNTHLPGSLPSVPVKKICMRKSHTGHSLIEKFFAAYYHYLPCELASKMGFQRIIRNDAYGEGYIRHRCVPFSPLPDEMDFMREARRTEMRIMYVTVNFCDRNPDRIENAEWLR